MKRIRTPWRRNEAGRSWLPPLAVMALLALAMVFAFIGTTNAVPSTYMEVPDSAKNADVRDTPNSADPPFDWANDNKTGGTCPDAGDINVTGTGGLFNCGEFISNTQPAEPPTYIGPGSASPDFVVAHAFDVDPLSGDTVKGNTCGQGGSLAEGDDVYTGTGGEKNGDRLNTETYETASVPPKDDLLNVYAVARKDDSSGLYELFVGSERVVTNGDTHADFEFLQRELTIPNPCSGSFSGHRSEGDILASLDFTLGGELGGTEIHQWHCNDTTLVPGEQCDPGRANVSCPGNAVEAGEHLVDRCDPDAAYEVIASGGNIVVGTNCTDVVVHGGTECTGPNPKPCGGWACRSRAPGGKDGRQVSDLETNTLMEAAIDLHALGFTGCIASFLPHTRTSQSFTSTLKDFAGPIPFNTCGDLNVHKYNDNNNNGADDSEPGLSGWTIFLDGNSNGTLQTEDANCNGILDAGEDGTNGFPLNGTLDGERCRFTNASGNASFVGLAAGKYSVCEVLQSGWVNTDPGTVCQNKTVGAGGKTNAVFGNFLPPDVVVNKKAKGDVQAGNKAQFNITVTNNGPGTAKGVTLNDTLPAGLTWTDDSADCKINSGKLACTIGTLADDATFSVSVSATTDATDCGKLNNKNAKVNATNEKATGNNTSSASITVQCPNLRITKNAFRSVTDCLLPPVSDGVILVLPTPTPTPLPPCEKVTKVNAGETFFFVITVWNKGDGAAKKVTLYDTLGKATLVSGCTANPVVTGGRSVVVAGSLDPTPTATSTSTPEPKPAKLCVLGTLQPGVENAKVIVLSHTATTDQCAGITNTAEVQANNEPAEKGRHRATARVAVNCPNVNVTKSGKISYVITVTSKGTSKAATVNLNDLLPGANLTWVMTDVPAVEGCKINGAKLTCTRDFMQVGTSFTVHVEATIPAACGTDQKAVLTNKASVSAAAETRTDDNSASVVICVPTPPPPP